MNCPVCGKPIPDIFASCPYCGSLVPKEEAEMPLSARQQAWQNLRRSLKRRLSGRCSPIE